MLVDLERPPPPPPALVVLVLPCRVGVWPLDRDRDKNNGERGMAGRAWPPLIPTSRILIERAPTGERVELRGDMPVNAGATLGGREVLSGPLPVWGARLPVGAMRFDRRTNTSRNTFSGNPMKARCTVTRSKLSRM